MALLKNSVRLWMRSVRLFTTEPQSYIPSTLKLIKGGGRAVPTMLLNRCNFAINKYLEDNESVGQPSWADMRQEVMASTELKITETTVDMAIINLCLVSRKINVAMSYIEYLWDNGYNMNLSSMMTYLKLCYVRKDKALNETERDYLLKMYNAIRERYPVLDRSAAECCIMGISMTDKWKDSFELLDTIKILDNPCSTAYSAIIRSAFEHNEPQIGWKYLREVLTRLNPDHSVYIAYLDYCTRNFKGLELESEIGKMIEFWGDRDVRPYVSVISAYEQAFADLGWTTKHTSIRKL